MSIITLSKATIEEEIPLMQIFEEAKPSFQQIEGRDPLPPLISTNDWIPEVPHAACHCLSIYYARKIIGYLWVFDDSPTSFYVFHFYLKESYRGLGLARLAMRELERNYDPQKLATAELVVSTKNVAGLKFWTAIGFDRIMHVYETDTLGSKAVEWKLQKQINPAEKERVHLLPVTQANASLGEKLQVNQAQKDANFVLSVPEAILAANECPFAKAYFICLDNQVIGYTAFVFDETIPEQDKRNWLWQFMIDENYQKQGYAKKALTLIIEAFRQKAVAVITLSTKPENATALELYRKFGFHETGEVNGEELILQKRL